MVTICEYAGRSGPLSVLLSKPWPPASLATLALAAAGRRMGAWAT
jgi:hypothetical protein